MLDKKKLVSLHCFSEEMYHTCHSFCVAWGSQHLSLPCLAYWDVPYFITSSIYNTVKYHQEIITFFVQRSTAWYSVLKISLSASIYMCGRSVCIRRKNKTVRLQRRVWQWSKNGRLATLLNWSGRAFCNVCHAKWSGLMVAMRLSSSFKLKVLIPQKFQIHRKVKVDLL